MHIVCNYLGSAGLSRYCKLFYPWLWRWKSCLHTLHLNTREQQSLHIAEWKIDEKVRTIHQRLLSDFSCEYRTVHVINLDRILVFLPIYFSICCNSQLKYEDIVNTVNAVSYLPQAWKFIDSTFRCLYRHQYQHHQPPQQRMWSTPDSTRLFWTISDFNFPQTSVLLTINPLPTNFIYHAFDGSDEIILIWLGLVSNCVERFLVLDRIRKLQQ